jgi:hypothetical protein
VPSYGADRFFNETGFLLAFCLLLLLFLLSSSSLALSLGLGLLFVG